MALTRIIPSVVKHVQSSPATVWTIAHNIGTGGGGNTIPIVDVYVTVNGAVSKIIPKRVERISATTVAVEFSTATSGTAIVIA